TSTPGVEPSNQSSDPSSKGPAPVVPVNEPTPASETQSVSETTTQTHNPSTAMVAPNTHTQLASETRDGSASGAVAPRIPAASAAQPLTVVDAINARLGRLRDLLREAGTE